MDVLRYGREIVKVDKPFKTWDITEWLLSNNSLIRNESIKEGKRLKQYQKIKNRIKPVNHLLANLANLRILMMGRTKAERGDSETKEFRFSYSGYLIALMLTLDENNKQSHYDEIYEHYQKCYQKLATSNSIFWSIFLQSCRQQQHLEEYIDHSIQFLKTKAHLFFDVSDFLQSLEYVLPFDRNTFCSLWFDTLAKMDEEDYQLFLFDLKLRIEDLQASTIKAYSNYERFRYSARNSYDKVALEGRCNNCKMYFSAMDDVAGYMEKQILGNAFSRKCKNCNIGIINFDEKNSLFVP